MAIAGTNLDTGLNYRFLNFAATLQDRTTGYQNIFGTSGSIYSITIINITGSGSAGLLKLFDTTATITPGTTVPSHVLPFTASTSAAANSTTNLLKWRRCMCSLGCGSGLRYTGRKRKPRCDSNKLRNLV